MQSRESNPKRRDPIRMKKLSLLTVVVLMLVASSALASNYRVADTVYLPAVIKGPGAANSNWRTDVWISNLTNDRVAIDVAFAPTAVNGVPQDNRNITQQQNLKRLPTILNPNQRLEVVDILGTVFNVGDNPGASGFLIFFGVRENGTNVDCEAANNDCRQISVEGRIYTGTGASSFGQEIAGIPWYSYISADAASVGLDTAFIVGLRNNGDFRTNIGLLNASQYSTTTIRVRLFNQDGTQFGSDFTQNLPPLSHIQLNLIAMFPGYSASGGWVNLEQISWDPTNPNDPNFGDGLPGFLAYGSLIAQTSNDPTYLETQFPRTFSDLQIECIFNPAGKAARKHPVRR